MKYIMQNIYLVEDYIHVVQKRIKWIKTSCTMGDPINRMIGGVELTYSKPLIFVECGNKALHY